jgi:putative addiction module CopG family antidote
MRSTQQFSVTLPTEMAKMVKAKVLSGDYASESEVIRDGLRALLARDRAVENWLRQEVAPAYDRMKADPSRGRSAVDVRAALSAEQGKAASKSP